MVARFVEGMGDDAQKVYAELAGAAEWGHRCIYLGYPGAKLLVKHAETSRAGLGAEHKSD